MKKKFTLIELIVVIAVLGILATIVLPNISGMKEKTIRTAVVADTRTLQTVSDMYQMENKSALPTIAPPTEQLPQPVDFSKIYPDQLRNLPKTEGVKYWVDVNGTVWSSFEDMPQGFNYDSTTGNLTWSKVPTASGYQVQEVVKSNSTSALGRSIVKYKPVQKILDVGAVTFKGDTNKTYAISSIDKYGFVSAPISTTAGYESGYQDTLESIKKGQSGTTDPTTPTIPTAPLVSYLNLVVTPQTLDNNSKVTTSVTSTDTTQLNIKSVEYRVDGGTATTTAPTGPFTVGTHTIDVRAQDQSGTWTDWVSKPITVSEALAVLPKASFLGYYVEQPKPTNEFQPVVTMSAYSKDAISAVVYRLNPDTNSYYRVNTTETNPNFSNGKVTYIATDLVYQNDPGEYYARYRFEFTQADGTKNVADGIVRNPYGGYKTYAGYTQTLVPRTTQSVVTTTSTTAQLTLSNVPTGGRLIINMKGRPMASLVLDKIYDKSYTSDVISLTGLIPNTLYQLTYTYNVKNGVFFEETQYFVTNP